MSTSVELKPIRDSGRGLARYSRASDMAVSVTDPCPLCGAPSATAFVTIDRNRHVSDREFRYCRCSLCRVVFLRDVPEDLGRYYDTGYHRAPARSELDSWSSYESYKLEFLRSLMPAGRVVDIGSSYGAFVYLASRAGYEATAVEVDEGACTFIRNVVGVEAVHSAAPEEALESVGEADVITMWHSIEHLAQPWRVVEVAARLLRPGGALVVATPNPDGLQARWLKGRWTHIDAPRHLFLIPRPTLVAQAQSAGLSPGLMTSSDVETRRCNRTGWQRGLRELGLRVAGVWGAGLVLEIAARPIELRLDRGSAYVAVFTRPG
jgi:2-polyprenyl-3-methyl-5-hydroxy-6-metoxy-1,4-benzoquinol methylase